MIDGGVKKKDRQNKSMVDKISASIILQSFLDNRSNKKKISKRNDLSNCHIWTSGVTKSGSGD